MYLEYIILDEYEQKLFGDSRHEYLYKIPIFNGPYTINKK